MVKPKLKHEVPASVLKAMQNAMGVVNPKGPPKALGPSEGAATAASSTTAAKTQSKTALVGSAPSGAQKPKVSLKPGKLAKASAASRVK